MRRWQLMSDVIDQLRKRVLQAPGDPGVYRWLNAKGDVLYIGKAKNLKNRLKSYVQENPDKSLGPWKLSLIKHIADFDVTVTKTELEALILETNMIKEVKPKYNVLMKDDKNYVYVRITKEDYPYIEVVRKMEEDNARYFGPYLSSYNIKRTLDTLHEIFRFRSCKKSIENCNRNKKTDHPCLEYQIGQCNGLCVGDVSQKQYNESMEEVMRFLKGDHRESIATIKDMMDSAAAEKKYEKAAKLRDTLMYIESIGVQQVVSDTSRENTDAIGIALQSGKVQVVVMRERNGRLIEERTIEIAGEKDLVSAVLCEFIPQYYSVETDIPDLILIQDEIEDKEILEAWLQQIREQKVEIRAPERGKKSKLLALAESNAKQKISQQFAKWEAAAKNIESALDELKSALKIDGDLKRIEGYDISHLGGTETVGSMVVIKNGKPANKEYRSFTIRSMQSGEIDDYKSLKEVLTRRLKYLTADLKAEETALKEKGLTCGKAKKKEQERLEEIIKENPEDFHQDKISYKDFLVIREEEAIVGCVRMYVHEDKTHEIKTLWVDSDKRGEQIGSFLCRKVMHGFPKEKIYISIYPDYESYYSSMGFQYVRAPPDAIAEKNKSTGEKVGGKFSVGTVLVSLPANRKADLSLTSIPDLLVIDGGKGQLSTVVEVLKELDLDIPVIGLAKREEEVYLPGASFPVDLPNNSQASFLLQRLRNEAHRFANAHREKRIAKGLIGSALDDVPGIGEKTKKDLLNTFGTIDNIKNASDDELLKIVNEKQLQALRKNVSS